MTLQHTEQVPLYEALDEVEVDLGCHPGQPLGRVLEAVIQA